MNDSLSRRNFLKTSAVGAGSALLASEGIGGAAPAGSNPMQEWYCSLGMVYRKNPTDDGTSRVCGVVVKRNEWPVSFSLAEKTAKVRFITYFRVYKPGKEVGFKFGRTFGSIFTSNTPVVVEGVRRFAQVKPFVSINQWTTPAVAIGS
jgi:hypothetical protein